MNLPSNIHSLRQTKKSIKPKKGHTLIAHYTSPDIPKIIIKCKTDFPKLENHFVYGDRVDKILFQIHQFHQKSNDKQTLLKQIKLSLGDTDALLNDKLLEREIYPKMKEIKEMQHKSNNSSTLTTKTMLEVSWINSSTKSLVNCTYMHKYESEILSAYNEIRRLYQEKWKASIKRDSKISFDFDSLKRSISQSMQNENFGGRKIPKMEGIVAIDSEDSGGAVSMDERENEDKEEDSTEEHKAPTNLPAKTIFKKPAIQAKQDKNNTSKSFKLLSNQGKEVKIQEGQNGKKFEFKKVSNKIPNFSQFGLKAFQNNPMRKSSPIHKPNKSEPVVIEIDDD